MSDRNQRTNKPAEKSAADGRKRRITAGGVFLLLGILMILAGGGWFLHNYLESEKAGESSDAAVEAMMEAAAEEATDGDRNSMLNPVSDDEETVPEMDTITIDGYDYIGYIEAPSLGMTLSVMAETDEELLKISPGRYSGNLYSDDLVIAGHNYARHFSPFRYLEVGAEIDFIDVHGNRYVYEIVETEALEPTAVDEMIEKSENWDLTLYTCTLDGNARHTIRCKRVTE